jgi:hypothetical protein
MAGKAFPIDELDVAGAGTIGGFLFANRKIRLPPTLFHEIHIPLRAANIGREKVLRTELALEFIALPDAPFRGYRSLVGEVVEYPLNPEDGYIDASVYLLDDHHPVDVSHLAFTGFARGALAVTVVARIAFETGFRRTPWLEIDARLRPRGVTVDSEVARDRRKARAVLSRFVAPELLGAPALEDGRIVVPVSVGADRSAPAPTGTARAKAGRRPAPSRRGG